MRAPWRILACGLAALVLHLALPVQAEAQIWVIEGPGGVRRFTTTPEPGARLYMRTRSMAPESSVETAPYAAAIEAAAVASGLEPALIRAVIAAESAFDPRAVSPKGALGLMQLMPATAAEIGVTDVWDPEDNIRGGASHLARLYDKYGDVSLALAAYNAGEGAVERYGGIPPFSETRNYVSRVLSAYRRFQTSLN